jgi:hypothetical protein
MVHNASSNLSPQSKSEGILQIFFSNNIPTFLLCHSGCSKLWQPTLFYFMVTQSQISSMWWRSEDKCACILIKVIILFCYFFKCWREDKKCFHNRLNNDVLNICYNTGWAKSPYAPARSVVNLYLYCVWSGKWFKNSLGGVCDFCHIISNPPPPTFHYRPL